jgi:hypothetical protein
MAAFVSQNATGGSHLPSKSRVFRGAPGWTTYGRNGKYGV